MTTSAELVARVRSAATGTPYVVVERSEGFDLTVDVANAEWLTALRAHGLHRVMTHRVRLNEAKHRLSITDIENDVSWNGGPDGRGLSLHARRTVKRGRVISYSKRMEFGVDARSGRGGKVVDYTFRAGEGRDLIRRAAKDAGWSEQMGAEQRGALWFAGLTLAGLVIGFGWVGISALLG